MRRDRLTLGLMIGVPAIQLMLFGFAIQTEVRNLPTVVLDESRSSESRALVDAIENTGNFRLRGTAASREEIHRRIVNGEAAAAVIIPPDYTDDLRHGRTATAQVIVDAADPLASSGGHRRREPGRERPVRGAPRRRTARWSLRCASACGPGSTRRCGARSTSCPASSACCCR